MKRKKNARRRPKKGAKRPNKSRTKKRARKDAKRRKAKSRRRNTSAPGSLGYLMSSEAARLVKTHGKAGALRFAKKKAKSLGTSYWRDMVLVLSGKWKVSNPKRRRKASRPKARRKGRTFAKAVAKERREHPWASKKTARRIARDHRRTKNPASPKDLRSAIAKLEATARDLRKKYGTYGPVVKGHRTVGGRVVGYTSRPLQEVYEAIGHLKKELRKAKPQKSHVRAKRRNPTPTLGTLTLNPSWRTYGDLPATLKAKYRTAALMAARFDRIPLNKVPVRRVSTSYRSKCGLVAVGAHEGTFYRKGRKSARSGAWGHKAGDHGKGKRKTAPATVAVDAHTKQQMLVPRPGSKAGFSSDRGLTG